MPVDGRAARGRRHTGRISRPRNKADAAGIYVKTHCTLIVLSNPFVNSVLFVLKRLL